jgi:hypothetical protein
VEIHSVVENDARWVQTVGVASDSNYFLSGWIRTDGVGPIGSERGAGASLSLFGTWTRSEHLLGTSEWTCNGIRFNSGSDSQVTVAARLGHWGGAAAGTTRRRGVGVPIRMPFAVGFLLLCVLLAGCGGIRRNQAYRPLAVFVAAASDASVTFDLAQLVVVLEGGLSLRPSRAGRWVTSESEAEAIGPVTLSGGQTWRGFVEYEV